MRISALVLIVATALGALAMAPQQASACEGARLPCGGEVPMHIMHRWHANTFVVGPCPTGGWNVSPVINGVNRIFPNERAMKRGVHIHPGTGVYVDPDDPRQNIYFDPGGDGLFYLETGR